MIDNGGNLMTLTNTADQVRELDRVLLDMSEDNLAAVVHSTLLTWRESARGNRLSLLSSLLAKTSLVNGILPSGAYDPSLQGRAVAFLLRWAMTTLKPAAIPLPEHPDESWGMYVTIYQLYEIGVTIETAAKILNVHPAKVRSLRDAAEQKMTSALRSALSRTIPQEILRIEFLGKLFDACTDSERAVLAYLAFLTVPISPVELIRQLDIRNDDVLPSLMGLGMIITLGAIDQLSISPEMRDLVQKATPLSLCMQCYRWAADLALQRQDFIMAATYLLAADDAAATVKILLAEYESIVDMGRIDELYELIDTLMQQKRDPQESYLLRIAAGQAAMRTADVSTALRWYRGVLSADNHCLRAYAMYLSGKAMQAIAVDESVQHFLRGIELLETYTVSCTVLAALRADLTREIVLFDLYLGLAWIYIQEKPDSAHAKQYLQHAAIVLPIFDKRREADLHNGWAGLFKEQRDEAQVLRYRYQAWTAAQETESIDLQIMTAHNLGQACIWNREFDRGEFYVQQAINLAVNSGDRQCEAKCLQTMGVSCFFQEHYAEAVRYYGDALKILQETGNLNWIAWAHHDLAEAYANLGEISRGRAHVVEAQRLAAGLQSQQLTAALSKLQRAFPSIHVDLNEQEAAVLGYAQMHGEIANRSCVELLNVSSRTANRVLSRLVEADLLVKTGQGRAVCYLLPQTNAS
ncbi:MAG: tetratricopeptide repeat protein [Caldilineaceae bacterium]|nr:tetratricopeptide repeat protein [Caldilineaceae bacterium]